MTRVKHELEEEEELKEVDAQGMPVFVARQLSDEVLLARTHPSAHPAATGLARRFESEPPLCSFVRLRGLVSDRRRRRRGRQRCMLWRWLERRWRWLACRALRGGIALAACAAGDQWQ